MDINKVMGVQPMREPLGLIYYLRYRYASDKESSDQFLHSLSDEELIEECQLRCMIPMDDNTRRELRGEFLILRFTDEQLVEECQRRLESK